MRKLLKKSLAIVLSASMVLATPIITSADEGGGTTTYPGSLVGYYQFENDLSNTVSTGSSASLHGGAGDTWDAEPTGTAAYATGKNGTAYEFLGDSGAVSGEGLELDATITSDEYTISLWIKATNFGSPSSSMVFANHGDSTFSINSFNGFNGSVFIGKSGAWGDMGNSLVALGGSSTVFPTNKWTYLTVTSKSGDQKLYMNGAQLAAYSSTHALVVEALKNQKIFLGINKSDASFKGFMDDVAVFGRALDSTEVKALYDNDGDPSVIDESVSKAALVKNFTTTLDYTNQKININYNELITGSTYTLSVSKDGEEATNVSDMSNISVVGYGSGTYVFTLTASMTGYVDTVLSSSIKLTIEDGKVVNDQNIISGVSATKGIDAYTVVYTTPVTPDNVTMKVEANGTEVVGLSGFTIPFSKLTSGTTYTVTLTATKAGSVTKTAVIEFEYIAATKEAVYDPAVLGFYSFDDTMLNDVTKASATTVGSKITETASSSVIEYTDGIDGKAALLTGAGSDGLVLDVAPTSKNYTISFAVKTEQIDQGVTPVVFVGATDQSDQSWLAVKTGAWGDTMNGPMIWSRTDGTYFDVPSGANATTESLEADKWAVITTVISDDIGKIYVDGIMIYEGDVASVITSATKVFLGVNAWDTPFSGSIDNVAVINTNISAEIVAALAKANGNPDGIKMTADSRINVTGVTLNQTSKTLIKGNTLQLKATVAPSNATKKTVTWKSSDTSVATVDANGKVTAKKAGTKTATITATTVDGSKTAKCVITVKAKTTSVTVKAAGYTLKSNKITLIKGKSITLKSTVAPSTATQGVTYKIKSGSKYITLKSGKVTAKKVGTAKVRVTSKDGLKKKDITIKVVKNAKVNKKLTVKKLTVKKGATAQLNITTTAGTTQKVTYTVKSGKDKVKVDKSGYVTGKKKGTAKIQVKCGSVKKTITVTVKK